MSMICFHTFAEVKDVNSFVQQVPINQVTEINGQLYVRLISQRRTNSEPLELLMLDRASMMAAYWLCNLAPKPNERLEARLIGVNIIYSQETESRSMDVVVRINKQKPECVIKKIETATPLTPSDPLLSLPNRNIPTKGNEGELRIQTYSSEY